jgi:hypothetical protein
MESHNVSSAAFSFFESTGGFLANLEKTSASAKLGHFVAPWNANGLHRPVVVTPNNVIFLDQPLNMGFESLQAQDGEFKALLELVGRQQNRTATASFDIFPSDAKFESSSSSATTRESPAEVCTKLAVPISAPLASLRIA